MSLQHPQPVHAHCAGRCRSGEKPNSSCGGAYITSHHECGITNLANGMNLVFKSKLTMLDVNNERTLALREMVVILSYRLHFTGEIFVLIFPPLLLILPL